MSTSTMTDTKRYLEDVPQEYVFWCCDGRILKNLRELRDAFAAMSEDTFAYHANTAKNDFYNWVRDIIKDDTLASDLLKAANTRTAVRVVTERIASLSSKPVSAPATTLAPKAASAPTVASPPAQKQTGRKTTRR